MLFFILFCLLISIGTIINYIFSGFHSKNHRMLPMLMICICLYYFYLLVELLTDSPQTFVLLKDLLIMQLFAILFYYVVEIMEIKIKTPIYILVSILDIIMLIIICLQITHGDAYRKVMLFFLVFISMHLSGFVFGALVKKTFTRNQRNTYIALFVGFLVPLVGLIFCILDVIHDRYIMAPCLLFTCVVLNYLLLTDKMTDAKTLMKEELFASAGTASLLFDADLYFLDASNSAMELFPEAIKALEESPKEYKNQEKLRKWIENNSEIKEFELNGRYYSCILQKVFLKTKLWGYILLLSDVTIQKEEANRAHEDAKNKSNYMAKMSHELRSPLHAIIGGSDIILGKKEASETTLFMISQIRNAGDRLLGIVNSILEFSKMENGVLTLMNRPYDFYNMISDLACTSLVNLSGKNVSFAMETLTPVARNLCGDEMRVREIIQNLLSNAEKFTPSGSVECQISMEDHDNRAYITVKVKDTGYGMTQEQISNIFTEFYSYANEQYVEGTGLGLPIVKELCNVMGGSIKAESDGVSGTLMTATFIQDYADLTEEGLHDTGKDRPPFVINESNASAGEITEINRVLPAYRYPKARVLVVDDMDVNHHIFYEMTRPWEFSVDKAYSGMDAIEMVRENSYDLIILDQMMPQMSGLETIDAIRKNIESASDIPVIMLTADITDEMRKLSEEYGFSDYLEKPIVQQRLKEVIENYLPAKHRRPCLNTNMLFMSSSNTISDEVKLSYLKECENILEVLPELAKTDMEMFRTKVHGLKGVSRQLNQATMAEFSEVMEMAAKSGHTDFINRHIGRYLDDITLVIDKMKQSMV